MKTTPTPVFLQTMYFISRHPPTTDQYRLAMEKGYELVHVGDRDAFTVDPKEFSGAVAVVHPATALRLLRPNCAVGVFQNANRAPEGERPQFEAQKLVVFSISGPGSIEAAELCEGIGRISVDGEEI